MSREHAAVQRAMLARHRLGAFVRDGYERQRARWLVAAGLLAQDPTRPDHYTTTREGDAVLQEQYVKPLMPPAKRSA